ncbi:DNA-binding response regulator [Streptomyces sp. 4.24]|uniref:response regulator transcription factor n=1 Tax=Streptomyces tritrimontium TaxID=3406573 RepID=UPI003BB5905A
MSGDREMRTALRHHLRNGDGINLIGEAWDDTTARERIRVLLPDVVVVHTDPRIDAFSMTRELTSWPDAPRFILVGCSGKRIVERSVTAGASGLLAANSLHKDLVRAVYGVREGNAYFSAEMTKDVIDLICRRTWGQAQRQEDPILKSLTDRQREVLNLLATGLSNAEIASALDLRVGTVKTHVSEILTRLGANNRVEAARLVFPPSGSA